MPRKLITDEIWEAIRHRFPEGKKPGQRGGSRPKYDNRVVLEATLWIARTGSPWRDLPKEFGHWNSIYHRFNEWCQNGVFNETWFSDLALELDFDLDTVMVDGTFAKVHKHGTGAPKADALMTPEENRAAQAISATSGGLTTKIMALGDGVGRVIAMTLKPGNTYEAHSLRELLEAAPGKEREVIADRAYYDNATLKMLDERDSKPVIRQRRDRKDQRWLDPGLYKVRHFIENRFAALKDFRGVATRYHKLALTFYGLLCLVIAFLALREALTGRQLGGRPAVNRQMNLHSETT